LKYKWVHKIKYNYNNATPTSFRSRLTVKGCAQKHGIDYKETFSPVAKITNLRIIIALGVIEAFHFWQLDVSNAFPNADLEEETYMEAPAIMKLGPDKILKLLKALYGLKQASRAWHQHARTLLAALGFRQLSPTVASSSVARVTHSSLWSCMSTTSSWPPDSSPLSNNWSRKSKHG
jgi:hypothetical protein